jgi:PPOX class probable F420-dependent enzyme
MGDSSGTVAGLVEEALDLLHRPLICCVATLRPDGSIQVNPMWFTFEAPTLCFSHSSRRAKFRNLQQNPAMTVLIVDPGNQQRYLEVTGQLTEWAPDPGGAFHLELARRYGEDHAARPPDAEHRVKLVMLADRARYRPGAP